MKIKQISAGTKHSLAVTDTGNVYTWGWDVFNARAIGIKARTITHPTLLPSLEGIVHAEAGKATNIAVDENGVVWSWGWDLSVPITPKTLSTKPPHQVHDLEKVVDVCVGYNSFLTLRSDGTVWAWGHNNYGQLGIPNSEFLEKPTQLPSLSNIVDIASGWYHGMALEDNGTLWIWGWNEDFQVGISENQTSKIAPSPVKKLSSVSIISADYYQSVIVDQAGGVWTWGGYADTSDPDSDEAYIDVKQETLVNGIPETIVHVENGFGFAYAVTKHGKVYGWGYNAYGRLGFAQSGDPLNANLMTELSSIIDISAGWNHGLALTQEGRLLAWGDNTREQLGVDTLTNNNPHPVEILFD